MQRLLIQLHRAANERPSPFVDHTGILRDSKTGRPINGVIWEEDQEGEQEEVPLRAFIFLLVLLGEMTLCITFAAGYSFFDSAEVALLARKKSPFSKVGK